jgi:2-hydroxy-6-oxonona-2,4-dienedioate hydrolase
MTVFENSAHWPQWEEPERFNREHLEFLLGK